jgi:hypothetical protein
MMQLSLQLIIFPEIQKPIKNWLKPVLTSLLGCSYWAHQCSCFGGPKQKKELHQLVIIGPSYNQNNFHACNNMKDFVIHTYVGQFQVFYMMLPLKHAIAHCTHHSIHNSTNSFTKRIEKKLF